MVVPERVVAPRRGDEVCRHEAGALVDELIEGVLAVGARLAPDDRPGLPGDRLAVQVDVLAVALHVALLHVGGEAMEVLVIGQRWRGSGRPRSCRYQTPSSAISAGIGGEGGKIWRRREEGEKGHHTAVLQGGGQRRIRQLPGGRPAHGESAGLGRHPEPARRAVDHQLNDRSCERHQPTGRCQTRRRHLERHARQRRGVRGAAHCHRGGLMAARERLP